MQPGPLALAGGNEFRPGNEATDRAIVAKAAALGRERPAYVIATAAARHDPDATVATARDWFSALGLDVSELRLRTRREARSGAVAETAARGRFFYLAGGDPGLSVTTLAGTSAWDAIVSAWLGGAVLAGSSAGAMALGAWTLIRSRMPGDAERTARPALNVVPGIAVIPHFDTLGERWLPSGRAALPPDATILGLDERTAAVWSDGVWRVHGPGAVRVIAADREVVFNDGQQVEGLPAPGAP
jgi:cyanophycinase